jgi:hypothetical protein
MHLKALFARALRICLTLASLSGVAAAQAPAAASSIAPPLSRVWVADNGDGTYKNPIIHADYSDPDAVRVGDDFYMTASSFNAAPGLPILHSKDLVNWRLISYVFTRRRLGALDSPSQRRVLHLLS